MANGSGWTLQLLQEHLQDAVAVELFTIPLYLTAWWSIKVSDKEVESEAELIIKSVVYEEMLHLELACNVLNAVGGQPTLTGVAVTYPAYMPFHKPSLQTHLGPVSLVQIATFMAIELPTYLDPAAKSATTGPAASYDTIGEFYAAVEEGLKQVFPSSPANPNPPLPGDPKRQITQNFSAQQDWHPVTDVNRALAALNLIVEQGEGSSQTTPHPDDPEQDAHYWRFGDLLKMMIADPRWVENNVWNMLVDPQPPGPYSSRSESLLRFFDACYSCMLQQLENGFNGHIEQVGTAVNNMFNLVGPAGQYLVKQTDDIVGMNLTPRFHYSRSPVTPEDLQAMFNELSQDDQSGLKHEGLKLPTPQ